MTNQDYFNLCEKCGKELYPKADFRKLGAITMARGQCKRCGRDHEYLTPVNDYEYASGTGGVWD